MVTIIHRLLRRRAALAESSADAASRQPSRRMLPPDGGNYSSPWIADSITIHSDGNVTCGLDDPYAVRSFGNVNTATIAKIFANVEYEVLSDQLALGRRCADCSLYTVGNGPSPLRPRLPTTLVVEPTVRCNIRCPNAACIPNNDPSTKTREKPDLSIETFRRVVDELKETLQKVYFFNYGDPFMNRNAEDMLRYLRKACPKSEVVTSTNGIPLASKKRAAAVAEADPDFVVFTISGMKQESYARYHVGGRLDQALAGLNNVANLRRQSSRMKVVWRYLAFNWNDSEDELEAALAHARALNVDQFSIYLTHLPPGASSYRLAPGMPLFEQFRDYIDVAHGYAASLPDAEGWYAVETIPDFGLVRWSSSHAILHRRVEDGRIRFSIGTNRRLSDSTPHFAAIRVPWGAYRTRIPFLRWADVVLPVPAGLKGDVPVEIETCEPWYPGVEMGSADPRRLGLLLSCGPNSSLQRNPAAIELVEPATSIAWGSGSALAFPSGRFRPFEAGALPDQVGST